MTSFKISIDIDAETKEEFETKMKTLNSLIINTVLVGSEIAPVGPWRGGIEGAWFNIEVYL